MGAVDHAGDHETKSDHDVGTRSDAAADQAGATTPTAPAGAGPTPSSLGQQQVQRRATVGAADDPAEHEADRTADRVMRMAAPEQDRPTKVPAAAPGSGGAGATAGAGGPGKPAAVPAAPPTAPAPAAPAAAPREPLRRPGPSPAPRPGRHHRIRPGERPRPRTPAEAGMPTPVARPRTSGAELEGRPELRRPYRRQPRSTWTAPPAAGRRCPRTPGATSRRASRRTSPRCASTMTTRPTARPRP